MQKDDKKEKFCLVCALEAFDAQAVAAYREAVRLSLFYAESSFSFRQSKTSKMEQLRWRDIAHRIKQTAIDNLKKRSL